MHWKLFKARNDMRKYNMYNSEHPEKSCKILNFPGKKKIIQKSRQNEKLHFFIFRYFDFNFWLIFYIKLDSPGDSVTTLMCQGLTLSEAPSKRLVYKIMVLRPTSVTNWIEQKVVTIAAPSRSDFSVSLLPNSCPLLPSGPTPVLVWPQLWS